MVAIRTLCPMAWALGHSVPYSSVVTLVLKGRSTRDQRGRQ